MTEELFLMVFYVRDMFKRAATPTFSSLGVNSELWGINRTAGNKHTG